MQRSVLRKMRVFAGGASVIAIGSLFFAACSDKAALPTATDNQRIYNCDDFPVRPVQLGPDDFASLYRDIFSVKGVAKCQTAACHGNTTGPGNNGMAMYPSKFQKDSPGKSGEPDDRGVYCGLTMHHYQRATHLDPCPDPSGLKCACQKGDTCKCASGPNAGMVCCSPDPTDPKDDHCDHDPTACFFVCGTPIVTPHADGTDSTPQSALLSVLSPKDGGEAFMPQVPGCGFNRKLLPEELARLASWLKRGAPYDGDTVQPAYDCPPPVKPQ